MGYRRKFLLVPLKRWKTTREIAIEIKQMSVDLSKSMDAKKVASYLNLPISGVRAISEKFSTITTLTNKVGEASTITLHLHKVSRMVRDSLKSWKQ